MTDHKLPIPAAALAQHVIALGKTGSGKSSKLRVIVEYLLAHDKPVCIIDPKGDWWGLKSSADGRRSGFPIVIFGGEHADVPLNAHAGAAVAELVATGNRSCLIDLGGWMVGERTRFFLDFAAALFKHARGARHLVIDEVHNFAPKGKVFDVDAGKMLHWANRLASEGRGKGLTLIAASQRPQKVHNDFLTSCETLIAGRVIHKADRDAIKDWIDGCADPAKGKEVLAELAGMKRAEAWCWSPEINFGPERIAFPMFTTYDSFKPQAADQAKLKGWAEVNLDEVKTKLAAVVAEAKANDPAELRRQIAELRRDLTLAKRAQPAAPVVQPTSTQDLEAAEARGQARGVALAARAIKSVVAVARQDLARSVRDAAEKVRGDIEVTIDGLAAAVTNTQIAAPAENPVRRVFSSQPGGTAQQAPPGPRAARARQIDAGAASHRGNGSLPPGERAILGACIQYPDGLDRSQLTVLSGYKRSSRDAYIFRLREKGYVATSGERVNATPDGIAALPDYEPLPTGDALREFWTRRLPEGERKVLEVLCAAYPDTVPRAGLDEQTGYRRSSRDAYLSRLAAKQLVTEPERGYVRASETLFQ